MDINNLKDSITELPRSEGISVILDIRSARRERMKKGRKKTKRSKRKAKRKKKKKTKKTMKEMVKGLTSEEATKLLNQIKG